MDVEFFRREQVSMQARILVLQQSEDKRVGFGACCWVACQECEG